MRKRVGSGVPTAVCDSVSDVEGRRVQASGWCGKWLQMHAKVTERPCAVFDIDSTLIHGDKAIVSMCQLHEKCHQMGMVVFWITARSSEGREATMQQMVDGIKLTPPRHLFMHPVLTPLNNAADAAKQKRVARDRIRDRNYFIVLNAGDQHGDHTDDASPVPGRMHRGDVGVYVDEDGCAHIKLPTIRDVS